MDANGLGVPGVAVAFSVPGASPLIRVQSASGTTDAQGQVSAQISSASTSVVGLAELDATVLDGSGAPTSVSTAITVQVRGARPSASHFSFLCDRLNLPVYTTPQQSEQMVCHVALGDRFGNRIGIPTVVTFHTEAGTIGASVQTARFDPSNPMTEGTADVTFTSNMAGGYTPADVEPLPGEPSRVQMVNGQQLVLNPRDHLVTMIAITQGEEAFFDANNNGAYDPGELFVDMPDPFIDANDDDSFDAVRDGGPSEQRFCSTQNPTVCGPFFSLGNGQWDSNATLWVATHVVFSGLATPTNVDLAGVAHTPSGCLAPGGTETVPIYAVDDFLNLPAQGTTFAVSVIGDAGVQVTANAAPMMDTLGLMTLQTSQVAESDGGTCSVGNGAACSRATSIDFGSGAVGDLLVANQSAGDGGACADLQVQLSATNAHASVTQNQVVLGQYQP